MSLHFAALSPSFTFATNSALLASSRDTRFTQQFMNNLTTGQPVEPEYFQAVQEVAESVSPVIEQNPRYQQWRVLENIARPNRVIEFKVPWIDDRGQAHFNRGWRIQQNDALGPYKGGLRFHPSVNLGVLKFLAFEQVFKNSLTGLPMGGGKGGADFDPKGKSDLEVMRFCQSFMTQLARHIGHRTDVPAGDIGVGGREIGYLYGHYKRLQNASTGALTGKGAHWGGSLIRPEATGYGSVYFAQEMLRTQEQEIAGKRVAISGSGNVAQFTAEKILELGGIVVSMSDSAGTIIDNDGITREKLTWIMQHKNERRGRISDYADQFTDSAVRFHAGARPWTLTAFQLAFPSATQNEINEKEAQAMVAGGCILCSEGANMPTEPEAIEVFQATPNFLYGPGKAANAGGVAVSGLEMAQNFSGISWSREEVDKRLQLIMESIHRACVETAAHYNMPGNYVAGANIAGFIKVADALIDFGV